MGFQIEDGTGKGYVWQVDSQNRGIVRSITEPRDYHINEVSGKVWSCEFGPQDPTGADDYVFYIKNTGTQNLSISDFRLSCTGVTGRVNIDAVTGTAAGGSTITPTSRNLGSAATVEATVEEGVNITGLTSGGTIFYMELDTVSKLFHLRTTSKIIIPKGTAIAIACADAGTILSGIVSVIEEE